MKSAILALSGLLTSLVYSSCLADNAATATNVAPESVTRIIISLIAVVGILIGLGIAFKKLGLNRIYANFPVKVIGSISIGSNQRLMIIEADDEWIVLGVTPQHISTLTSMPRQEISPGNNANPGKPELSSWMQSALEKYRTKNP